eukprot:g3686.t1
MAVTHRYFAPDEPGDVVVLLKDSATHQDVKNVLLQILGAGLTPRLQSLRSAVRGVRQASADHSTGCTCCWDQCECCTTECCHAKCVTRGEGFLGNILPPCVTQHAVENTSFDHIIFVTATNDRLLEEKRLLMIDDWLQSNIVDNVELLINNEKDKKVSFSVSERSYLLYRALEKSIKSGGAGLRGCQVDSTNPIALLFTLHDTSFLKLMSESLLHVPKFELALPLNEHQKKKRKITRKGSAAVLDGVTSHAILQNTDVDENGRRDSYVDKFGTRRVLPEKIRKMNRPSIKVRKKRHSYFYWFSSLVDTFNQLFLGDVNMPEIRTNTLRCIRQHPDVPLSRSEFFVHEIRHQYGDHMGSDLQENVSSRHTFDDRIDVMHKMVKGKKMATLKNLKNKRMRLHDLRRNRYITEIKQVQKEVQQKAREKVETFSARDIQYIIKIQKIFRAAIARTRVKKKILQLKQADEIVEEAGLNDIDDFLVYIDLTAQLAVLLFFGVAGTWVPLAMLLLNTIDLRVRIIALCFSYRVPKIKRDYSIGEWETFIRMVFFFALIIMPMITMYSGPYLDSLFVECFTKDGRHKGILLDPETTQMFLRIIYAILGAKSGSLADTKLPFSYLKMHNTSLYNATMLKHAPQPCLSSTVKMWYVTLTFAIGTFNYLVLQKVWGCPPTWLRLERERRMFLSKNRFISNAMIGRERKHEHASGYAHVIHKVSTLRDQIAARSPVVTRWESIVKKASRGS